MKVGHLHLRQVQV